MQIWRRWADYRRAQRERLAAQRTRDHADLGDLASALSHDERLEHDLIGDALPEQSSGPRRPPADAAGGEPPGAPTPLHPRSNPAPSAPSNRAAEGPDTPPADDERSAGSAAYGSIGGQGLSDASRPRGASTRRDFGTAGIPFNRQSPFYIGFVGAVGVLTAYAVVQVVGQLSTVITLLVISLFLTLSLNPLVQALASRRMPRPWAVAIVFLGVVGLFALIGSVIIPPVAAQSTELANHAPGFFDSLLSNPWVQDLDHRYQLIRRIQEEVNKRVADGNLWAGVFGGVLGAGKIIAAGIFSALTVLVLTLYFLASLPSVKQAAYSLVPASRRPRIVSLAEEVMRRVGSYAIGQVCVAGINACFAWVMMTLIGLKFAAVLAVAVGLLGLVPMVGATLGAVVVALVAFFDEPKKALIVIAYFIVYQQIENYAVMPRVMQRTVSVPGAVTIVAALAGGTLLGVLGALLAIPFAAGALLIYEEVLVPRQRQQ